MHTLKSVIASTVSRWITSPGWRDTRRDVGRLGRKVRRAPATVIYFHQSDDPYSLLLVSHLPELLEKFQIQLQCHVVPAPEASAAPDLQRLAQWSERDVARLQTRLKSRLSMGSAAIELPQITAENLQIGAAIRQRLGHYMGAMLYFEGEWYWGLDRLHYLESRLYEEELARDSKAARCFIFEPPTLQLLTPRDLVAKKPEIHFFCSLRSPYTYLAAPQVRKLAQHYGATLHVRFVLPMVMRGLPVPWIKRLYILRDTKREAMRLNQAFGKIVDPVGQPVEYGLAVLHAAISLGLGSAWLEAFLKAVFAEGIDAGQKPNLLAIAKQIGLQDEQVLAALKDSSWRAVAERNRQDMLDGGIWGVPAFRVDDGPIYWGQDRIWMLEEDLLAALNAPIAPVSGSAQSTAST